LKTGYESVHYLISQILNYERFGDKIVERDTFMLRGLFEENNKGHKDQNQ
jgi:hypothetical protein